MGKHPEQLNKDNTNMRNKISISLIIVIISFFVVAISMDAGGNSKITGASTHCVRNDPGIVVSPASKQIVGQGGAIHYTVTLTNRNSGGCTHIATKRFYIELGCPINFRCNFDLGGKKTIQIEPGVPWSEEVYVVIGRKQEPVNELTFSVTSIVTPQKKSEIKLPIEVKDHHSNIPRFELEEDLVLPTSNPTFSWTGPEGTNCYSIFVKATNTRDSIIAEWTSTNSYPLQASDLNKLYRNVKYHWKIDAYNLHYGSSCWGYLATTDWEDFWIGERPATIPLPINGGTEAAEQIKSLGRGHKTEFSEMRMIPLYNLDSYVQDALAKLTGGLLGSKWDAYRINYVDRGENKEFTVTIRDKTAAGNVLYPGTEEIPKGIDKTVLQGQINDIIAELESQSDNRQQKLIELVIREWAMEVLHPEEETDTGSGKDGDTTGGGGAAGQPVDLDQLPSTTVTVGEQILPSTTKLFPGWNLISVTKPMVDSGRNLVEMATNCADGAIIGGHIKDGNKQWRVVMGTDPYLENRVEARGGEVEIYNFPANAVGNGLLILVDDNAGSGCHLNCGKDDCE